MLLSLLLACNGPDQQINVGKPDIEVAAEAVDVGEVVLGYAATLKLEVRNEGIGDLTIDEILPETSTTDQLVDFTVETATPLEIGPGDTAEIEVRYQPDLEEQDLAVLWLYSDDEQDPELPISLSGYGIRPLIEVEPDDLYFGYASVGESVTRTFEISAAGSGHLLISDIAFADGGDGAGAYTFTLPANVTFPYSLDQGNSFDVTVTFAPGSDAASEGQLLVSSNDPTTPEAGVNLLGNIEDNGVNDPPVVQITSPSGGSDFLTTDPVTVTAFVYDNEDAPQNLFCYLMVGVAPSGVSGSPDVKGNLVLQVEDLEAGELQLTVACNDSMFVAGSDTVTVDMYDPKEPLTYTINGGVTLFDYWTVDDDVIIYVDGVAVFSDTDHTTSSHPPIEIEASVGSQIRIVATDINACDRRIEPLYLHFGSGYTQKLTEEACASTCLDHDCYDPELEWESEVFFDETVLVEIP